MGLPVSSILVQTPKHCAPCVSTGVATRKPVQLRRAFQDRYRLPQLHCRVTAPSSSLETSKVTAGVPLPQYLEVGTILTTHGVKGEVKVQALTDFPAERLAVPGQRWLQAGTSAVKECFLERGRCTVSKGREVWIVKLRGVNSMNDAQLLHGHMLLIDGTDRPDLEDDDEFLTQDLIGIAVVLQHDTASVGTVIDVYDGTGPGNHDLLKILLADRFAASKPGAAMLLPFVKEFVPHIDIESNVMHICPPPGLLELAVSSAT